MITQLASVFRWARHRRVGSTVLAFVASAALLIGAHTADAQTSSASVSGYVRNASGGPVSGADVAVRSLGTNALRGTSTNANGFYFIGGLVPGQYDLTVRSLGLAPQTRRVSLFVGQTLSLDLSTTAVATQLSGVQVTAAAAGAGGDVRSTETGINVTQAQINQLPTPSRNFLDLAQLAPGVTVTQDRLNGTGKTFSAGALPADNINVFIDGASYKNDIISGGVAGQDASRGNPFPRNAVQEFRVITNNFRAEYQKASSAIITAVTKSGTNEWHGSLFTDIQNQSLVSIDTFQRAAGATKPNYKRYLTGISAGGPIIKDKLFFFGSYEGNYQDRDALTVFGGTPSKFPSNVQPFNNTAHQSPFRENLGFGKLTWLASNANQVEFSGDIRHEVDTRGFGGQFGDTWRAYSGGENHRNNVYTGRVKDTYSGNGWTNEALLDYQHYLWNQDPIDFTTPAQVSYGEYWVGGDDAAQALTQNRLSLRDDWTYHNFHMAGDHVIKIGGNYDLTRYDMNKQLNDNPTFVYNSGNNYQTPVQAIYGYGNGQIKQNNNQFGAYAQDTWNPTQQLRFDLGLRWDVETGMFNRNYVTPQNVRDSLTAYASKLYIPIDPNRYFTNGTQRGLFLGGVQPRVGVNYLLDKEGTTAVFASLGKFYDRLEYNATLDETYRRQHPIYRINFAPNGTGANNTYAWNASYFSRSGLNTLVQSSRPPAQEVFLIPNDLKPPNSNQWSIGIRHDFGGFNGSVTYNGTRSYNGFSYEWANVNYNPVTNDCCIVSNVPAYQNVLVGNNSVHTWYDAMLVQLNRPYTRTTDNWGWGGGIAYTLARAEQEGNDLFSFPMVTAYGNARHPTANDRRNQFVFNWITDIPYAWGIQFSGLAQLQSGSPFNKTQFVPLPNNQGNQRVILGQERTPWFKNVDLRFRKDFLNLQGGRGAGITASVFNVFNTQNLGCYDETFANPGSTAGSTVPNAHFGKAGCTISDPRRLQFGLTLDY